MRVCSSDRRLGEVTAAKEEQKTNHSFSTSLAASMPPIFFPAITFLLKYTSRHFHVSGKKARFLCASPFPECFPEEQSLHVSFFLSSFLLPILCLPGISQKKRKWMQPKQSIVVKVSTFSGKTCFIVLFLIWLKMQFPCRNTKVWLVNVFQ